jgi:peptide/nickel transport system permease protein
MIGFETVATTTGLIIGAICGLVPLGVAIGYGRPLPGIAGFIACVLSGFACGFLGGLPMIILATAVVISYVYVDVQDPFTSRASIDQVNFDESASQLWLRRFARLGHSIRQGIRALVRNRAGFLGFLGVAFFAIITIFGPLFIEYDGRAHMERRPPGAISLFQPPSAEFPLGLDWQGRDILSHLIYGGQRLIVTSVEAGVMTTVLAVALGAIAALIGGLVDQIISAITNFILTIPQLPLLVVLATLFTFDNYFYLAVLFAALSWPVLMRAVRAQVLSVRERDYVQAAVALDLGLRHIIVQEVLPNLISYIVVNLIFSIRAAMYSLVGLVFLGLVPIKEPDWGVMIVIGRQQGALNDSRSMWMLLTPVLAIALFQLSLVLFTRSLEEIFNPRLRRGL